MNAPGMNDQSRPSLLERLSALLMREPNDRSELTQLLRSAYSRNLLDAEAKVFSGYNRRGSKDSQLR